MRLSRTLALAGAAGVVAASVGLTAGPAAAAGGAESSRSCSAGGFTGTLLIQYLYTNNINHPTTMLSGEYRINKGGNSGGNSANVNFSDGGTIPAKHFGTGSGVQDNRFHSLFSSTYSRGTGTIVTQFIFDKSRASDPSCIVTLPVR